jgi:hypothetical protein
MQSRTIICALILALCASGCSIGGSPPTLSSSAPPSLQVIEGGSAGTETVTEIIHMNNCGGKGDAKQVAQRGLSVVLEGEGSLGVDVEVVRASVNGRYGETRSSSKTTELVAPPGTDMEFELSWTEQQWLGRITSQVGTSEAQYRARVPIAVELKSSRDIGTCTGGAVAQPVGDAQTGAPPSEPAVQPTDAPTLPPPTPLPPSPVPITPTPELPALLENGQTLQSNGWALTVSNFTYKTLRSVHFSLQNNSGKLALVPGVFQARVMGSDGSLEAVICFHSQPRGEFPQAEREIGADETVEWTVDFSDMNTWSECYGPEFYPTTRELILTIDDLGGLFKDVRWKTEIPRP